MVMVVTQAVIMVGKILTSFLAVLVMDWVLSQIHVFWRPDHARCEELRNARVFLWGQPLTTTRWFQLHCVCNWIIVWWSWAESLRVFLAADAPQTLLHPSANGRSIDLAIALHVYHCMFWPLKQIDVLHHATSVFVCCPIMYHLDTVLTSWHLLIGTGIPGGIDYLFLTLVKYRVLPIRLEKRVNAWLNAYMRAPLGAIGSYMTLLYMRRAPCVSKRWGAGVIALITYWNATFFAKRAVESNAVYASVCDRKKSDASRKHGE